MTKESKWKNNLFSWKSIIVASMFGLASMLTLMLKIEFYLPEAKSLSDLRENFNSIGSALTGPVGGIIIGFLSTLFGSYSQYYIHLLILHIINAVFMGWAYKKFVYGHSSFSFAWRWILVMAVYFYIAYIPTFLILYLGYHDIWVTLAGGDLNFFTGLLERYKGFFPESIFTICITTLAMLALPDNMRKPLWGKPVELTGKKSGTGFFKSLNEKLFSGNYFAIRISVWFLIFFALLLAFQSLQIRNYSIEFDLNQEGVRQQETTGKLSIICENLNSIEIYKLVDKANKGGDSTIFITDHKFNFLYPNKNKDFSPIKYFKLNSTQKELIRVQKNGIIINRADFVSISFSYIQHINCYIFSLRQNTRNLTKVNEFVWLIYKNLGITFLSISFLSGLMILVIVGRPLKKMTAAAEAIGQNNYEETIDHSTMTDEVALLAKTINSMQINLRNGRNDLVKAKEEAEKSNRLKSEFLAQMSHEIRSPINVILSFSNLIKSEVEDKVSDELKEGFHSIANAGQRIIRTIDLLLNMSEIQAHTYEFNPRKIDLFSYLTEIIIPEYKYQAQRKNIAFTINNTIDDCKIVLDEYTINQIFANLIDNAIKYTENGEVIITIGRDEAGLLICYISDTGIGMSSDFMDKMFQPFSQEEQGYTRKYEGNGLGLALVKKYCELNNIIIQVKSEKGKGTTFTLTFLTWQDLI